MINIDNEKSFVNALHKIANVADRYVTLQESKTKELSPDDMAIHLTKLGWTVFDPETSKSMADFVKATR